MVLLTEIYIYIYIYIYDSIRDSLNKKAVRTLKASELYNIFIYLILIDVYVYMYIGPMYILCLCSTFLYLPYFKISILLYLFDGN